MKKMKKIVSLILTVIMVLAMAVPSFAEPVNGTNEAPNNEGSIVISNAIPGEQYKVYKIFDLESYSYDNAGGNEDGNYSYTITSNSDWYPFVSSDDGSDYIELLQVGTTGKYYISWKSGGNAAEFAKAALEYANDNAIDPTKSETAPDAGEGETTSTVTISELELGYYLVDSPIGALCSLNTTNDVAEITEKNEVPTVVKEVKEGSVFGDKNTAQIGDEIEFKITINAKRGAQNYVLHDKMSDGLTLDASSVEVADSTEKLRVGSQYTLNTTLSDGCDFEITFAQTYLDTISADETITVTYKAILNENAVIHGGVTFNTNEAMLEYGDKSHTTWDGTETDTFSFDLVKTDNSNKLLAGAEFELYAQETGGSAIPLVLENGQYRVATSVEAGVEGFTSAKIVTNDTSMITVVGLDGNTTYWLEETKAPEGYNMLSERVAVPITDTNISAAMTDNTNSAVWEEGDGGIHVINKTGTLLPSTGGIGTTIFYAAGIVLMAGAVFFVVRRKRA